MSCVHACVLCGALFFANFVPCAAGDGVYNSLACLADIRVPLPEGEVASAEASLAAAGMFCPHHLCACHGRQDLPYDARVYAAQQKNGHMSW